MRIHMTGHSVCGFDKNCTAADMLSRLDGVTLRLCGVRKVHEVYYPSYGYVLFQGLTQIGWVPKHLFHDTTKQLKQHGFEASVNTNIRVYAVDTYVQDTGKIGLVIDTELTYKEPRPISKPTLENGATPVSKLPTLQQVIDANMAGLSTAAQLETGHVANLQLTKIVGKRLPKQYELVLKTPFGHLLMANAVSIAAQALYPQNALLKKVSNAMVVDSYQELLKMVDVPGIIDELLNNKEVLSAHAKDEAEKD